MDFVNLSNWEHVRNKELANLFYYSLNFNNQELALDCIKKWKEQYQEIDSLFYAQFSEPSKFPSMLESLTLVSYQILKINTINFGTMSPNFFKDLQVEGLTIAPELSTFVSAQAVSKNNIELLDYMIDYIDLNNDLKLKRLTRIVVQHCNEELLNYFLHNEKTKKYKDNFVAYTILWNCALNSNTSLELLYKEDKKILLNGIKTAQELLNKDNYIVHLNTRTGVIGLKEDVEKVLLNTKIYYSLNENAHEKNKDIQRMKI